MELKIIDIAHQRNGVGGEPFSVVLFDDDGPDASRKIAIVFGLPGCVAVFDFEKLSRGLITQRTNGWRGDCFESALRDAIARYDASDA